MGPQSFQHFPAHHYFVRVYRHVAVMLALLNRTATFLSSEEWRTVPWKFHPKSALDRLLDILFLSPGLFVRTDALVPAPATTTRRTKAQKLLHDCLAVESQLDHWHATLTGPGEGEPIARPIYWAEDTESPSAIVDPQHNPFAGCLAFRDDPTALALLTYWTALLLLNASSNRVHAAVCAPVLDDYPNLYPDLPPSLRIDASKYRQGREYASCICRGLDFALAAGVQVDALVAPLVVAQGVYREINTASRDGELEVVWCEAFREGLVTTGQYIVESISSRSWVEAGQF
ncbi:hypothetical protein SODALDRAFT_90252 [Sodiomyces alkalinus F11]|uniref:Uncharacterized protein n=1 Tax=Sodiomyces alkalinus (strain CBS 110278 / VKM F-3762 / F11) TaxID=1314773 RepID=A0A3N2Q072_SODAK|nr:hypothetical protein SODALDRAFT_90252 [Sodiomyces alkalinus F11]ROT40171.1 hypothetical protein SODALDRAFT_90252 [Sodiomyces alkalinus F11]